MDRNKNLSTTLDEVNMNELESNFDARYIKGIFDAFQYVGGDLSESIGKQGESVSQNSSEILHTIKSLTSPRPLNKEVSALKLDVLTQQANLSKQSNKIKTVSSKLDEKRMKSFN